MFIFFVITSSFRFSCLRILMSWLRGSRSIANHYIEHG